MSQNNPLRASIWMLGAVFGFSALAVAGRQLSNGLDTFEIMTYRSLIGIFTVLILAASFDNLGDIRARALHLHLGRNLAHFAGQNLWLFALTLIPLAQLFAMEFSYPIIVSLGAVIFLGEKLTKTRVITSLIGFMGILLVAAPFEAGGISIGILAATACAFGFAGSAIFTKLLTQQSQVSITQILFWLCAMQLILGLICAGFDRDIALPSPEQLPWIAVISWAGLAAHFCLTKALTLAPASVVTPIDFLRLPLIAFIGAAFYAEPLRPVIFIGAVIIFAANYVNIRAENHKDQPRSA